jgi:hypothetical protein
MLLSVTAIRRDMHHNLRIKKFSHVTSAPINNTGITLGGVDTIYPPSSVHMITRSVPSSRIARLRVVQRLRAGEQPMCLAWLGGVGCPGAAIPTMTAPIRTPTRTR